MTVFIVAGGTGGHLYPGIAVARQLKKLLANQDLSPAVQFVVRRGDLGKAVLEKEGFSVHAIDGQGMPRVLNGRVFSFPFRLLKGWAQAFHLLRTLRPRGVLGMGGYLTFPVLLTAKFLKIPTMIHEQNVKPGLANRLLSRWVSRVAVSFERGKHNFPPIKTMMTGLPVRSEIGTVDHSTGCRAFGFSEADPVFLVFGGSLGARRLNQVVCEAWALLQNEGRHFQVLHITGEKNFIEVQQWYAGLKVPAKVISYCHEMANAYACADLVVSRSGASTVAELEAAGRPAVLVPYPFASDNHQQVNAEVLQEKHQAEIIIESDLTATRLADVLRRFLTGENKSVFTAQPSHAAERLARAFEELL